METTKPKALVLCAGIGLVSQALKETGFDVVGAVDYAEIPEQSYTANFPHTPFWRESLRAMSAKKLCYRFNIKKGKLDIIQISTPCTGYSPTGEFEPTDTDNELLFVALFLALQLLPKVILFENVPGMTYSKMKVTFGFIAGFFKKLEEHYHVSMIILNSEDFGDPQSRDRVFIQCVRKDIGEAMWPLPLPKSEHKTIGDVLPGVNYLVNVNYGERRYQSNQAAPTVTGHAAILLGYDGYERKAKAEDLAPLMGLKPDFKLIGNEAEKLLGVGNGVPVGMMSAILRTVKHDVLGYESHTPINHKSIPDKLIGVTGYTLYKGPSRINGEEIIAVLIADSSNEKTGNMAQLYILPYKESPIDAVTTGADEAVCGGCALRHFKGGGCYVPPSKAPYTIWKTYQRGEYPLIDLKFYFLFEKWPVRFGAYGDPFAIPTEILIKLKAAASNITCYTHQWQRPEAVALKEFSMASVESEEQQHAAQADGWRTYRIVTNSEQPNQNEIECPHYTRGIQCVSCNLCSGNAVKAKNITVRAHGFKKKKVKVATEREQGESKEIVGASTVFASDSRRIISAQQLRQQSFVTLQLPYRWREFIGKPSHNFNCVIHGLAGHGKSSLAMMLADDLTKFGEVVYISGEEGFNKTMQDKLKRYCKKDSAIDVADLRSYEEIVDNISPGKYRFIFIDSLDAMNIGPEQMRALREHFVDTAFVTVSQNTKLGVIRGSYELVHDADIAIRVHDGVAVTEKNRFKEKDLKFVVFETSGNV